ncbi:MAG: RnfABCDGE type electron transport complex subunit G [Calditerrivibrio sp.]|nr:RnfABCDGE type electron transport complex subunit G [Calditerrivibrio sp.]
MKNNYSMIIVLGIFSIVAAFLLSMTYQGTKDKIEEAYRQELIKALNIILPPHDNQPDKDTINIDDKTVYVAKKDGKLVGIAFKTLSSKGYSGDIDVLVGVETNNRIYGIEILRHAETPGLGSKIETDKFKQSFKGLTASDKIAVKKDGGIIDQFSGATISPRAVCEAVSNGIKFAENVLKNPQVIGGNK